MREIEKFLEITRRQFNKIGLAGAVVVFSGMPNQDRNLDYCIPPDIFPENRQFGEYFINYVASAKNNIIEYPNGEKVIVPSPAYKSGIYVRDSFYSVMGLSDNQLCLCSYREFEKAQNPETGQIPTQVLFDIEDKNQRWRDDESTMLFLIWSGIVKDRGESIDREKIEKAFGFVQKHVLDFQYYSEKDDFKYWADTLKNSRRQVITYNQGLYVCAMQACFENSWGEVTWDEVLKAKEGYGQIFRQNWEKGYLPQAQGQDLIDLSALFPEVLYRYLFNDTILPNQAVLATVDYYLKNASVINKETGKLHGVKIICNGNGSFLPPEAISVPAFAEPGDYQNGGYWPMWTLVDLALAYKIAPKAQKEGYRQIILKLLGEELDKDGEAKEYTRTCPDPMILGSTEKIRHLYSWNVFFNPIARWAGLNRNI